MHSKFLLVSTLVALTACNTWDGAKQDAQVVGNKTGEVVEETGEGIGEAARETGEAIESGAKAVKKTLTD